MTVAGGVRERLEALMAGRGDATLLGPPFDAIAQAKGLPLLRHVNMAYPEFPGQGLVVRREVLTRKMAAFRAWIEVMETVRQRYRGNEAAAVGTLISQGLPESAAHSLLAGVPDSFDVHDPGIKLLIRQRQVLGLPGADSCPEDLVDDRLLTAER